MGKQFNVKVDVRDSPERTLKKFKRMCEMFGIGKEYKKRKEYKKPSVRKKEKLKASEKRRQKAQRKYKKRI